MKRQTDGELDDTRLTEGLTGEAAVYKRRGMAKPEIGRPQIKYVSWYRGNGTFLTFGYCYLDLNVSGSSSISVHLCKPEITSYITDTCL